MQCPACGVELVAEAAFCHKCGQQVGGPGDPLPKLGKEIDSPGAAAALRPPPPGTPPENDDRELWEGRFVAKAMLGHWVGGGLLTILLVALAVWAESHVLWYLVGIAALLFWLYELLVVCYRKLAIRYRLTPLRLLHERGILRRKVDMIDVIDIDDISLEQSLWERLTGVGTIRILSSDRSHPVFEIWGIPLAKEAFALISRARQAERLRRGLHVEQV